MKRRFVQVDVFGESLHLGNPLAVVVDADGLSSDEMQRFAKWTNLSETTFLLPPTKPQADYRVRIFTPTEELPFAGHPTLGSAHAWLTHGHSPMQSNLIVQECGVGLVEIRRDNDLLSFAAPPLLRCGAADDETIREAADSLGIDRQSIVDAAWVDNGPGWLGILLSSAEVVLAIQPRNMRLSIGVAGAHSAGSRFAYEVRAFYSSSGITLEDPVTGSLNASLAQWLIGSGRFSAPYRVSQGSAIGHAGVVHVSRDAAESVWIGGNVTTCISGEAHF
jgi:PhzF family phenazine biosynthesis protein